jgi:hypothetical protein
MSNKSQTLEYFFYKEFAGDYKSNLSVLLKFGAAGIGVKTIVRQLILENDFVLTVEDAKSQILEIDRDLDIHEILNALIDSKEFYIEEGYIQSRTLDIQIQKKNETARKAKEAGMAGHLVKRITNEGLEVVLDRYQSALELSGTSLKFREADVSTEAKIKTLAFDLADIIKKEENYKNQ